MWEIGLGWEMVLWPLHLVTGRGHLDKGLWYMDEAEWAGAEA